MASRYTDKFKAGAVVLAQSEGYPDNPFALQMVADHLSVPVRTLRRWVKGDSGAPPDKLVQQEKTGMVELIDDEIRAAFSEMHNARSDASYRDLVIGAATLLDKKQLLTGEPTERTENTHDVNGVLDVRTNIQRKLARITDTRDTDGISGQPVH